MSSVRSAGPRPRVRAVQAVNKHRQEPKLFLNRTSKDDMKEVYDLFSKLVLDRANPKFLYDMAQQCKFSDWRTYVLSSSQALEKITSTQEIQVSRQELSEIYITCSKLVDYWPLEKVSLLLKGCYTDKKMRAYILQTQILMDDMEYN